MLRPMVHLSDSANIAYYREKGEEPEYVWCQVMRSQPYVKGQGFVRGLPTFYGTVYQTHTGNRIAEFKYQPKSMPAPGPLSPVTVTRLVRETLEKKS